MSICANEIFTFFLELICPYCVQIFANYAGIPEKMSSGAKTFWSVYFVVLRMFENQYFFACKCLEKKPTITEKEIIM